MTRSELIALLASGQKQLDANDMEMAVQLLLDAMRDSLAKGHRVEIRGFGSFSVSQRASRLAHNPKTGEQVQVPEKRVLHFKAGKALREQLNCQQDRA